VAMVIGGSTVKIDLIEKSTSNLIGLSGHKMVPDNRWLCTRWRSFGSSKNGNTWRTERLDKHYSYTSWSTM